MTWMYARIGVRIEWRIGSAASGAASGSPVAIQMRYANDNEQHLPLDSLAFALPFGRWNFRDHRYVQPDSVCLGQNGPSASHPGARVWHTRSATCCRAPTGMSEAAL